VCFASVFSCVPVWFIFPSPVVSLFFFFWGFCWVGGGGVTLSVVFVGDRVVWIFEGLGPVPSFFCVRC